MNDFIDNYGWLRNKIATDKNVVSFTIDDSVAFFGGSTFAEREKPYVPLSVVSRAGPRLRKMLLVELLIATLGFVLIDFIKELFLQGAITLGTPFTHTKEWWGFIAFQIAAFATFVGFSFDLGAFFYSKRFDDLLWGLRSDQMHKYGSGKPHEESLLSAAYEMAYVLSLDSTVYLSGKEAKEFRSLLAAEKRFGRCGTDFCSAFSYFEKTRNKLSASPSIFKTTLFFILAVGTEFASFLSASDFLDKHLLNVIIHVVVLVCLVVPLGAIFNHYLLVCGEKDMEYIYWVFSFAFLDNGNSKEKTDLVSVSFLDAFAFRRKKNAFLGLLKAHFLHVSSRDVNDRGDIINLRVFGYEKESVMELLKTICNPPKESV